MPDTGAVFPTVATNIPDGLLDWSSPAAIKANDAISASIDTSISGSNFLAATAFGFAVPAGSTIVGVEVVSAFNTSVGGGLVYLTKNGSTLVGTAEAMGASFGGTKTFGGPTSMWGTTLTFSEVNASTFGVLLYMEYDAA